MCWLCFEFYGHFLRWLCGSGPSIELLSFVLLWKYCFCNAPTLTQQSIDKSQKNVHYVDSFSHLIMTNKWKTFQSFYLFSSSFMPGNDLNLVFYLWSMASSQFCFELMYVCLFFFFAEHKIPEFGMLRESLRILKEIFSVWAFSECSQSGRWQIIEWIFKLFVQRYSSRISILNVIWNGKEHMRRKTQSFIKSSL